MVKLQTISNEQNSVRDRHTCPLRYNWEIIGHQKQLLALEDDLHSNNLAHAYLFSGPENVGKYTVAKRFAEILQCQNGGCGTCSACLEIHRGYHTDTLEIIGMEESIKIDAVREILARLYTKPQSKYKILLVKNIEKMTTEAANTLLKTLEEPPPQTVFLLTTSRLHEILLTVISRVRLCQFHIVSMDVLLPYLQRLYPQKDTSELEQIASFAFGRPGKALALLKNAELLKQHQELIEQIETFLTHPDLVQQFSFVTEMVKNASARTGRGRSLIKDFLDVLLYVLRTQMYAEINHINFEKAAKILRSLSAVENVHAMLKRNVNLRLILENLMLDLATL